jgi:hypothetical protein
LGKKEKRNIFSFFFFDKKVRINEIGYMKKEKCFAFVVITMCVFKYLIFEKEEKRK